MPDEVERQWVVEPPLAAGEISLYMAGGDGVNLTEEQEVALSNLLRTLERNDAEVGGFDAGCDPQLSQCTGLKCGKVNCSVLLCGNLTKKVAAATESTSWNLMGSFGSGLA
jgi:hypothetical protein